MPLHDWTLVQACIFHDFHLAWVVHLSETLKSRLPPDSYALVEQHPDRNQGDVRSLLAWGDYESLGKETEKLL